MFWSNILFHMFCLTVPTVRYFPLLVDRMHLRKHLHVPIEVAHLELVQITALIIDCLDLCTFFFVCNYDTVLSHFLNSQPIPKPCLQQIVFGFKFLSSTCVLFSFSQMPPSRLILANDAELNPGDFSLISVTGI